MHRTSFERLHRIDGDGWLQAGIWHFATGRGATRWQHRTVFLYAVNLFHNHQEATRAVTDEKLRARVSKIAHLPSRIYRVSDVHQTLVFAFFAYREVEVEAYYEYKGVAPTRLAKSVRHKFSTQTSHLAHYARQLSALDHRKPTATPPPTSTPVPTSTPLPPELPTATSIPTVAEILPPLATNTAIVIPTMAPTSTPLPTVVPTQTGLVVQAAPQSSTFAADSSASILVHALLNGQPPVGASVDVSFFFPGNPATCTATVDAAGNASCSTQVPREPAGTAIQVNVQVTSLTGEVATANTSFTIR